VKFSTVLRLDIHLSRLGNSMMLVFSTTFANRRCIIYDAKGSCITKIPQNRKGLYKLVREVGEVNIVNEPLTLDLLH